MRDACCCFSRLIADAEGRAPQRLLIEEVLRWLTTEIAQIEMDSQR